jgi:hypothetical protein
MRLAAFLADRGPDDRGRKLADVLSQSDQWLERVHDWVQWVFPLPEGSQSVWDAPRLTTEELTAIVGDPQALDGFRRALKRVTTFLERDQSWLRYEDHNHKRITRIIASTRLILGDDEARRFRDRMLSLNHASGSPISQRTLSFWWHAAPDPTPSLLDRLRRWWQGS